MAVREELIEIMAKGIHDTFASFQGWDEISEGHRKELRDEAEGAYVAIERAGFTIIARDGRIPLPERRQSK